MGSINPLTTAFLFPGQGSQYVGMGMEINKVFPVARQIFEETDTVLDIPLSKIAMFGPESELNDTLNTQPALLAHSAAILQVFQEFFPNFQPAFVAGHSMGELSALLGAGALSFGDALLLARRRGELMKKAGEISPGGMAAVFGADIPTLEKICAKASRPGEIVQVANDNCPGQVVISGSNDALERAIQLAGEAGIRKVRRLAVSIAAHSPLMSHAQERFNQAVADAPLTDARVPLIGNVTALPIRSAEDLRADLRLQLTNRVRWSDTIREMVMHGVTTFIEMGSGRVLTDLLRRIDPGLTGFALGNPVDFDLLTELITSDN